MIEETDITNSPAKALTRRALGLAWWVCIVLFATPVLLGLGLFVTYEIERATPEDYPRVAPEDMGRRATDLSQGAYDVLGFDRVVPLGVEKPGVGTENAFHADACYPGGLEGMDDEPVDGAYRLSHGWALDKVPEREAVPALRRLRDHLEDTGWRITEYREIKSYGNWELRADRDGRAGDGGNDRLFYTWYAERQWFYGSSTVPCAYAPAAKADESTLAGVHPPELTPAGARD